MTDFERRTHLRAGGDINADVGGVLGDVRLAPHRAILGGDSLQRQLGGASLA